MNRWRSHTLTLRLATWHAVAVLVVVAVLAIFVRQVIEHRLVAELDRQLRIDFDVIEGQVEDSPDGTLLWPVRGAHGEEGYARLAAWFEVWDENGRILLRHWPVPETEAHARLAPPSGQELRFYSAEVEPGLVARIMERPGRAGNREVFLRVLRDASGLRRTQRELVRVLFVGLPLALILAFGGGWFVARRSLAPLAVMAARASDISARSLSQRLPVANPQDELGQLGSVFNQMLGRLEASFEELRRFAADASHELRTPLTALRTAGEVALREKPSEARLRETLGAMLEDAQRMQDLVESLLVFARAEADTQPLQRLPIRCESLIQEVAENLRVLAEAKQQQLLVEFGTGAVVMGDPGLLRQAVLNVVHNAIRYTPPGGRVTIRGRDRKGEVHLEVEDTGTGIAVEHRPHVFERFYRVDPSRSRAEGGAGLGLAIARALIERHSGRIDLEGVSPRGCLFRITLPVPDRESSDVRVGAD